MIMDFFGKDNMSLDVSGQVHKVHGCMTENFHPASRAPGIGMPLPCGHFYFSCDIFDVRCRIGSDISTPNCKSTEAAFATNGFVSLLAVGLLSHCSLHLSIQGM